MLNNNINSAIDSVAIGGGGVYGLMNYLGSFHLSGGLKRYTLNRGFFFNNISNNFGDGTVGRYGYGDYNDASAKDKLEGSSGKRLENGVLVQAGLEQDKVGDYYTTKTIPRVHEKEFMSIKEFSLLGEALRDEALAKNHITSDFFKRKYGRRNSTAFTASGSVEYEIGDEVGIDENKATPIWTKNLGGLRDVGLKVASNLEAELLDRNDKYVEEPGAKHAWLYEVEDNPGYTTFESSVFGNVITFSHKIEEIGQIARTKYDEVLRRKNLLIASKDFKKVGLPNHKYGDDLELINEWAEKPNYAKSVEVISIPADGLYVYEDENIKEVKKKQNLNPWGQNNVYGIEGLKINDNYTVPESYNDRVSSSDNAKISDRFKSYLATSRNNSITYSYYHEKDGETVPSSFSRTSTEERFVAAMFSNGNGSSKRLTAKTDELFRNGKINSLVNRFHTKSTDVEDGDQLVTSYTRAFGMSRGRNLLRAQYEENGTTRGDRSSGFDNPYCRVWTAHHQYSKIKDCIRPFMDGDTARDLVEFHSQLGNMRTDSGLFSYSVLQNNGFVKISPHKGEDFDNKNTLKKYMFSIENLAWKGFAKENMLSKEQIGPNGGRIMWFPPYNLKFTENINTSWKDNDFIGRGEKIYTYVNTERGGTLNFTLLIDHPSIINMMEKQTDKEKAERDLLRYFAGCGSINVSDDDTNPQEREKREENITVTPEPEEQYERVSFIVFFPNNFSGVDYKENPQMLIQKLDMYETSNSNPPFTEMDERYSRQNIDADNVNNMSISGLNTTAGLQRQKDFVKEYIPIPDDIHSYEELKNLRSMLSGDAGRELFGMDVTNFELTKIMTYGYASDHGYKNLNRQLCEDRANTIKIIANYYGGFDSNLYQEEDDNKRFVEISVKDGMAGNNVNSPDAKVARSAVVTFYVKLKADARPSNDENEDGIISYQELDKDRSYENDPGFIGPPSPPSSGGTSGSKPTEAYFKVSDEGKFTYMNEYLYFNDIKTSHPMVHKNIVDKVKFFEPAFHSITPEGFNSRLNFLQQCTRQGPTIGSHSGGDNNNDSALNKMAGNLAFGMAPYCVLRIGDFFYSKIVITSISIDYDTGGGIQWDLNTEGAGVQPMMANVNINFNFIGGQNVDGPVAQLQNAISFNYYANSELYTNNNIRINGV